MLPILPAFAGVIPKTFSTYFPNATVFYSAGWEGFNPVAFLDPNDPMFARIQSDVITLLSSEYGSSHLYACDL